MERSEAVAQTCAFSTPARLARPYLGGRPPLSLRRARAGALTAQTPRCSGRSPLGPSPSSLPPLLSLLGQKLGPRGGSSSCLPSKAEAPLGYGRGG